jgi:tRNA(fMet)-specific endonuclease VapC
VVSGFLLDTSACIALLRAEPTTTQRLASCAPATAVRTAAPVAAELLVGGRLASTGRQRLDEARALLADLDVLPFDGQSAELYAEIKSDLIRRAVLPRRRAGEPLRDGWDHDIQIAAIARQHGLVIVTRNVGHFERMTGVQVENWHVPQDA